MTLSTRTLTKYENGLTTGPRTYDSGSVDTIAAAGAVSVDSAVTMVDSTAGVMAITLADGIAGQEKVMTMIADGGDATLTPVTLTGGATITFNDAGDSVQLLFVNSSWSIISNNGATVA